MRANTLCHAYPAQSPARAELARILLGPGPSLHQLRSGSLRFVRRLHSYYGGVRLLVPVHHRLRLLAFPMRTAVLTPEAFYFGESLIVDPRGDVIGHGSASQEDLVVAELDLECLKTQRKSWRFFEDRRPEGYGAISAVPTAPVARSRQMAN